MCSHTRQSREGGKERGSIGAHGGAGRQDGRAKFLIPSVTSRTLDRVECRGLHPGNLPHHRTCGFPHPAVEPGGLSGRKIRWHKELVASQHGVRQGFMKTARYRQMPRSLAAESHLQQLPFHSQCAQVSLPARC